MNITPLLDELFAMTYKGIKPGLERTEQLCAFLGDPQLRIPVIHVAGTNGKGSTCSMLAAILRSAGYRVGLYTSPHIHAFNERITVDAEQISNEDIARLAGPLMGEARRIEGTFFEVTTAMAFQYFAEKRVDAAIIETGLGGRLDSTNVVHPLLSVITSIDIDHTEYLGFTLKSITQEKAGIIKPSVPAVIGERRTELREYFDERGASQGAPLLYATDAVQVEIDQYHPDLSMTVSVIGSDFPGYYTTDLCGEHQAMNIATVFTALQPLRTTYFIEAEHVRAGLARVRALTGLAGRTERISASPLVILDVAHNPAGLRALRITLQACGYPDHHWQVVFGVMADKEARAMVETMVPLAERFHACAPHIPRALPAEEVSNLAIEAGARHVACHASVADAVRAATALGPTLICGSFHVVDEAMAVV